MCLNNMEARDLRIWMTYTPHMELLLAIDIVSLIKNKIEATVYVEENRTEVIIRFLRKNSFGVYIIHKFWINIIYKAIGINSLVPNEIIVIVRAAILAASILSTQL